MSLHDNKTAIVLIDPYNDFLHPEGKVYPALSDSLTKTNSIANMKLVVDTARAHKVPIYYGLHHQQVEGDFVGFGRMTSSMERIQQTGTFKKGSFGAEIYEGLEPDLSKGDTVASQHWNSNSFLNTDLDFLLRQRGVQHLVLLGMVANTCLEATARHAYELGYKITLIKDGTAGFAQDQMDAGVEKVWPLFANEIITAGEWVKQQEGGAKI